MACRCRPPPKSSVLRKTVVVCLRNQSSMHEHAPLAEGRTRLACPPLDAMPPRQCACSNNRRRRPHRAPAWLTGFFPRLRRRRPAPQRHLLPVHHLVLRVCLTSPHLLVTNTARPWLGAPHLRHIHRRLPFMAACFTQAPRSPLLPQVRRGAEDGKAGRRTTPSSWEDGRRAR
jgi:hypothetical protein